ncbi:MAG TPA: S53 family peptidase [Solirubrobacteraceae bacterium]|nr:S53 family peptidase [Solirubrobacteraceae bacterium]
MFSSAALGAVGADEGLAASTGAPSLPIGTRYAKVRPVCPAPGRGRASCFALALVSAPPEAAGASPYLAAAGAYSKGPAGGLTPADLATAYSFSPSAGGTGQTVGIVDAFDDPTIEKDLSAFDTEYGLAACTTANGCFQKVGQTGSTTSLPAADKRGWSVEMSLDVETVHSVCPSCKILVVEADSESLSDLAKSVTEAVKLGATEVSNSYGTLETELGEAERSAYNDPGVVITASAGDSGYLDWDNVANVGGVAPELPNGPASLTTVVAVGGTSLALTTAGARKSETVWNDSGRPSVEEFKQFSATGGGCSTLFTAPAWQQTAAGWASTACGTKRLDNDIAAVADPYTGFDIYDSYVYEPKFTPGWLTVGGTSLSSPLVAGLFGLAGGSHGVSYPASTLYTHLGQSSSLYDVTQGGDGYCDGEEPGPCGEPEVNELLGDLDCLGSTACDAAGGFDGPSGVGAPIGLGAFNGPSSETKPTVVTKSASSVTASSALLHATVNPNGGKVSACSFEYGPTTSLGKSVPCSSLPVPGTKPKPVSATLSELSAKTTYYYRISATDGAGTSIGTTRYVKTRAS